VEKRRVHTMPADGVDRDVCRRVKPRDSRLANPGASDRQALFDKLMVGFQGARPAFGEPCEFREQALLLAALKLRGLCQSLRKPRRGACLV
jgi:hypothetical protein